VIFVEPWRHGHLIFVHFVSEIAVVRHRSNKMDALATMIAYEIRMYTQWLDHPEAIKKVARSHFVPMLRVLRLGQVEFRGYTAMNFGQ
jgi:hypothetical protein